VKASATAGGVLCTAHKPPLAFAHGRAHRSRRPSRQAGSGDGESGRQPRERLISCPGLGASLRAGGGEQSALDETLFDIRREAEIGGDIETLLREAGERVRETRATPWRTGCSP
jgi:hypothetical protein